MNLSEERSRQKLLEVIGLLELTDKNRELAEKYLEEQEGTRELLLGAEPQDFSGLSKEAREKCLDYKNHCLKRNRKEEVERFVRFTVAVGGSTAYYVLVAYGWRNINTILEYLTREQAAAIRAEGIAWNVYGIKDAPGGLDQ